MKTSMHRRAFLTGTIGAAVGAPAASGRGAEPESPGPREYYELRIVRMNRGPSVRRLDDYFQNALIPAYRRSGAGPVGVFTVAIGPDNPSFYVLIPHPSAESACTLSNRLGSDPEYRKAATAIREATSADAPYANIDTRLMVAADFMRALEVPPGVAKKEPRVFELRTYRSHSKTAARKKLEMFGSGGELAIFRRTGLQPVFFAETLYGPHMPSLTYMLVFPDGPTREKNWGTFVADPEWKKLSTTPGYTDAEIVADIHNVILRPTVYSQI